MYLLRSHHETYVGTMTSIFKNDFTEAILGRNDIILIKISVDNREQIRDILEGLAPNIRLIQQLNSGVRAGLTEMARAYAGSDNYTQLKKLFKNTIKYLAEDRVHQIDDRTYSVSGDTNEHTVNVSEGFWGCDCDLYKGTGSFEGNAGECSHIQSVKLFARM